MKPNKTDLMKVMMELVGMLEEEDIPIVRDLLKEKEYERERREINDLVIKLNEALQAIDDAGYVLIVNDYDRSIADSFYFDRDDGCFRINEGYV